jgi:hypothetical protein
VPQTVSSGLIPWDLTVPIGSAAQWTVTFTVPYTGAPYSISGLTWEFVVRTTAYNGSPLFSVTTTPNAAGTITVTSTAVLSQILLALNPAATQSLAPGQYALALWSSTNTSAQFTWLSGSFFAAANAQP